MDLSPTIAANARSLRAHQKRRQVDVADQAGLNRSVLSVIESGQRKITFEDALALCRGLGCGLMDLLDGADPEQLQTLRLRLHP